MDQTAFGRAIGESGDAVPCIAPGDRSVLRQLAERVACVAASPANAEKRELWRRINRLEKIRPLIFCDPENGWNEIIPESSLSCAGEQARRWEAALRREVFWGEEMGDDKPVEPFFDIPYVSTPDDWGLDAVDRFSGVPGGARTWEAPIRDYDRDAPRLHAPRFEVNMAATRGILEAARSVFDGVLAVRLRGRWWWSLGLTQIAVRLRGMAALYSDFIEQPENLKGLMAKISEGLTRKLDRLEREGLLSLNNDGSYIGSGGFGFSDELPGPGFDGRARCADMWGFAESQETAGVSPEMYEEFVFPFERPLLDRFGLNCYGCCEPIHDRWRVVKRHSRLRRVSCSPWTDHSKMAEHLEDKYIFSMKPNPAALATPSIDRPAIRAGLRKAIGTARGCVLEIIMKDNHTIGNRPDNVKEWCAIAREEAERLA